MTHDGWKHQIHQVQAEISAVRKDVEIEHGVKDLAHAELRYNLLEALSHLDKALKNLNEAKEGRNGLTRHQSR